MLHRSILRCSQWISGNKKIATSVFILVGISGIYIIKDKLFEGSNKLKLVSWLYVHFNFSCSRHKKLQTSFQSKINPLCNIRNRIHNKLEQLIFSVWFPMPIPTYSYDTKNIRDLGKYMAWTKIPVKKYKTIDRYLCRYFVNDCICNSLCIN